MKKKIEKFKTCQTNIYLLIPHLQTFHLNQKAKNKNKIKIGKERANLHPTYEIM
jgi:hypothetical protein